jgi:3-hydroxyisobutyrate dehydrogenase-like beta-hydroxyacid dehydrogenase
MRIGLLHPGEMGAAFGGALRGCGHEVFWVSDGRSAETAARAHRAGLVSLATLPELAPQVELVLSICPPHAALDVARELADFDGVFVDANAVSPGTMAQIAATVRCAVDGSIIGSPPWDGPTATLYLSAPGAETVAELFTGTNVRTRVLSERIGAASAIKMAYAAWTKGSAALLIAVQQAAVAAGVDAALLDEWQRSQPQLAEQAAQAQRSAESKGWRWVGEMEQIADFFAEADQPDGFHRAAAEIYRRYPRA